MFSPLLAWKIVRDLGPAWVLKRAGVEAQLRLGILKRRLPVSNWDFQSREWLRDDARFEPEEFKQSLLNKSKFFFDSDHLPHCRDECEVCAQADRVLSGEWPYFSHRWYQIGFPPDWHFNVLEGKRVRDQAHWADVGYRGEVTGDRGGPGADIKFVWEPSRFSVVYLLARAYAATGDERYAEAFWTLIEDWAEKNRPNRGANWISGQEAAFRIMAWCFGLYAFLSAPQSTAERVLRLVRMIEVHGERIAEFIDYALSQRNNHGISEAVGLFTIGVLFPQLRLAAEWTNTGQQLIIRQLSEQVYEDGSYIQHSFNYHRVLIDNLVWAFRLGELNSCRFPGQSYELLDKAVDFMLRFCDPQSGKMPNYGANDGTLVLPLSSHDYTDYRPSLQAAHYLVHRALLFQDEACNEQVQWLFGGERVSESTKAMGDEESPKKLPVEAPDFQSGGAGLPVQRKNDELFRMGFSPTPCSEPALKRTVVGESSSQGLKALLPRLKVGGFHRKPNQDGFQREPNQDSFHQDPNWDGFRLNPNREVFDWNSSPGKRQARTNPELSRQNRHGPLSGYLKLEGRESYALLRAAKYRDRPSQADQLHMDLWWRGENIACDAGSYLYNGPSPWTNALAGTAVHNTVTIGNCDQMTRAGRFLWLDWAQASSMSYEVEERGIALEASHDGYKNLGAVHRRSVMCFSDLDSWVVVDDVLGNFSGAVRLHWFFPDYAWEFDRDRIHLNLRTPIGGFQCLVSVQRQASANIARAGEIIGGNVSHLPEVDLRTRGWRSLYYGDKEPALSLAVETSSRLPVRFVTVLAPADVEVVRLDATAVELRSAEREQVSAIELAKGPCISRTPRRCT